MVHILRAYGVKDKKVLQAMENVRRHMYIPLESRRQCNPYGDHPCPIGYGQTISQPFIVALMTDLLDLAPHHRVLEIGTGSAYQAAVLSELVAEVFTIEIVPELAASAAATLERLDYDNVSVRAGDGRLGWPEAAPFDRIIVTAVGEEIPAELLKQLAVNGRMVMPIGPQHGGQNLTVIVKKEDDVELTQVLPVQFVPLTGTEK